MKIIKIFIIAICLLGCYNTESKNNQLEGSYLPSFNLLMLDSSTYFNTSSIPKGDAIVLFYFAPWCPYSKAQTELIVNDINELKNIKFILITTSPISEVKYFHEKYELNNLLNLKVGIDYTNFFVNYFKAEGVPYIAIYGKNKKLKTSFMGRIEGKYIKEIAEK